MYSEVRILASALLLFVSAWAGASTITYQFQASVVGSGYGVNPPAIIQGSISWGTTAGASQSGTTNGGATSYTTYSPAITSFTFSVPALGFGPSGAVSGAQQSSASAKDLTVFNSNPGTGFDRVSFYSTVDVVATHSSSVIPLGPAPVYLTLNDTSGNALNSLTIPNLLLLAGFAGDIRIGSSLVAVITSLTPASPVPLPAAAWLFLSALGWLFLISRRRQLRDAVA